MIPHYAVGRILGWFTLGAVGAMLLTGWSGCTSEDAPAGPAGPTQPAQLVILTPHSELIREVFGAEFSAWHQKNHKQFVEIQWISMGTVDCLDYVNRLDEPAGESRIRVRPDLLFGGGITEHELLARRGQAQALDLKDAVADIPETILGLPTRDGKGHWHATAFSGFGILFNRHACEQRAVPVPTTWADVAQPEYYGWVALAAPNHSGSNRQCLTLILQKYGWNEGWPIILRIAANSRALLPSSTEVTSAVRNGVALAGPSASFTAMQEVEQSAGRLSYANPPTASAMTPDVITLLNGAEHPEVAERFVRFCLSEPGQALWGVRAEARGGYRDTLYRHPVLPGVYEKYTGKMAVAENPLAMKSEFALDMVQVEKQWDIVAPLLWAAAGENGILLQNCWKRLIDAGLPPEAVAELTRPPFREDEAYALGLKVAAGGPEADALLADWTRQFRERYEKVLATLQ